MRSGHGRGLRPAAIAIAAGLILAGWALSGLYVVEPDQRAVVTRLGAYAGQTGPGLNYHLPAPFERVRRLSVTGLHGLELGGASADGGTTDGLMVTGDGSLVNLGFAVQWRIADPAKYLARLSDPEATLKLTAEAAMNEAVGRTSLKDIMTAGRARVQADAAERLQHVLNAYDSGIAIVGMQIRAVGPPQPLLPTAQDIGAAAQEAITATNQANAYRNQVIDAAKGEAAKTVQDAEGEREQEVRVAGGEASHFAQVDAGYRAAPALTRQRIYLDTMRWVLSHSNKVVVDLGKGTATPIMLPPSLFKPRQVQPQAAPAQVGGATVAAQTGQSQTTQSKTGQSQTDQASASPSQARQDGRGAAAR